MSELTIIGQEPILSPVQALGEFVKIDRDPVSNKRIVSADSQIITAYQSCPRKCRLSFIELLRGNQTIAAIDKGSLLHDIFEVYYSLLGDCVKPNSEKFKILADNGLVYVGEKGNKRSIAEFAMDAGQIFAVKSTIDPGDALQVFYQCKEYFEHFQFDEWIPVAVEQVGTRVIYEDANYKFIYNMKIDVVMLRGNIYAAMDHKTSSRRQAPSDMTNQFMGYAWGLNSPYVLVNKIGFQKTLTRSERFERHLFSYMPSRIGEWVENTIETFFDIVNSMDNDRWPMRFNSCDMFTGCNYKVICGSAPNQRDWAKRAHFTQGEVWDVANLLEAGDQS